MKGVWRRGCVSGDAYEPPCRLCVGVCVCVCACVLERFGTLARGIGFDRDFFFSRSQ